MDLHEIDSNSNKGINSEHNISSSNYHNYFSKEGNILSTSGINNGDTLNIVGNIKNKFITIDRHLNIVGGNDNLLQNCTFRILNKSSGTNITKLNINNNGKIGIILDYVSNCNIKNNKIFCIGYSSFTIALNPGSTYNNISYNFLKSGTFTEGSTKKSTSTIVLGAAHYNYIGNNYLECDDANVIYLSRWGSGLFVGGESNFNLIYNNTIKCMVIPTSWCYGIQLIGNNNKLDSNTIIGTFRGISSDFTSIIINNKLIDLKGKDYNTGRLKGAEYGIIAGYNSTVFNNQIINSIIENAAISIGSNSTVSHNHINVAGKAYGINVDGDYINILNNKIITTSGTCIYQSNNHHGLIIDKNNLSSNTGIGILIKSSNSNITITNNIIKTYNKYAINIKNVNKETYILLNNSCNSNVLTPNDEIESNLNSTCLIINVSGTFDDLNDAIDIIKDGGIVNLTNNIHCIGDFYDLSGIIINKSLTIEGNNFQINAHEKNMRVFNISSNVNVTLKNTVILGCYLLYNDYYAETLAGLEDEYSGGAIYNNGNLTIVNVTFISNKANIGGAIYNNGSLDIFNSTFRNNKAICKREYSWENEDDGIHFIKEDGGGAGAIYNNGVLNIKNSVFHNNLAESSTGAIYNDGSLNMDGCLIFSNKATGPAAFCGAIYNADSAFINNSKFLDNRASSGGVIVSDNANLIIENSDLSQNLVYYDHWAGYGGVLIGTGNITIVNSNFTANTCQHVGGVIATFDNYGPTYANITINGCNFNENFGGSGGAIYNVASGSLNIIDSNFNGNKAGDGAAILNLRADMLINGSSFNNNIATYGVIYAGSNFISNGVVSSNGKNNKIINSAFINNKGGALNLGGHSLVDNSSFIGNKASNSGGGLYASDVKITNSNFINNSAKKGNGVYIKNPLKPGYGYDNGYFDENGLYNAFVIKPNNSTYVNESSNSTNNHDNPNTNNNGTILDDLNSNDNDENLNNSGNNTNTNSNNSSNNSSSPNNNQGEDNSGSSNNSTDLESEIINDDNLKSNSSSVTEGFVNFDSLSHDNSSNIDSSLSSVGEIPNAPSAYTSTTSNPFNNIKESSSFDDSSKEKSSSGKSKAYELKKSFNKKVIESAPIVAMIIIVFVILLLLVIGYRYRKNNEL